jgi:benzoyl-CoA reductase/2-hydroxyglutaryl-CoA dehydratase subunit BcrC/BadD/HgdB
VKALLDTYLEEDGTPGLEAVVFTDSCDAIRRMCDVWRHYLDVEILDFIDIPRLSDSLGVDRFAVILEGLAAKLEDRFGCSLEPDALREAIGAFDRQRRLMSELRRRRNEGGIGSEEYYSWIRRLLQEDPAETNEALRERLAAVSPDQPTAGGPRILLVGSLWVRPDISEAVEKGGGRVVFEDTCSDGRESIEAATQGEGSREQLLRDLAARYLAKPPCPRMRDLPWRLNYLLESMRHNRVDGVICCYYKFCDLFLGEYPTLNRALQGAGCPTLLLEDEGGAELSGQQHTRIQAFLEML